MSYFKPDENINPTERKLLVALRVFLLAAGIYITIFGGATGSERIFGVLILVALVIMHVKIS